MSEHPFDEWFARTYPDPQPEETRETAMISWNAALDAARAVVKDATNQLINRNEFVQAAFVRDTGESILALRRKHEPAQQCRYVANGPSLAVGVLLSTV